uniref:Uncharacterized protein n=1 Tax=Dunaliella tertiolecta TaxID=3047 RepID=A0A7S3R5G3_DUNTE|mmetsp:Transcript_18432/g.51688  ORF Transcript_18432/g.51688 Transcript_18432/m.51688 type:complete len:180 (+) Transcript_18432:138-677(+)|eukprot:CAMPEP_0202357168 /NCGR_PEP_ID=MMETSP1126-20121109/11305_1 /ASSEMBLY_ACC=CAM_ASM_000457 /TAXON_ID=3047 /ORGANISM="Dunaliella tertiolecta, Strain CCMP1320" /LENGTH=179 /DNA_ID=CAMNT_0048949999 /DNA_START=140 /DNA_END=679 /DNA_ORIENTATION=-
MSMLGRALSLGKKNSVRQPRIALCKACEGKGCESYNDGGQMKQYGACRNCSSGNGPYGLGIKLKCFCSDHSQPFTYIMGPEAKHFKGAVPQSELADLVRVQNAWGDRATAVLLVCQNCGATHMCKDGDGERRAISGMEETNKYDKAHNRNIASKMVANGIYDRTALATYTNPDAARRTA